MARSIDDYENRRYLHKTDLPTPKVFTLAEVTDEKMEDGSIKPAVHFQESKYKPCVLNKTNMRTIARITGSRFFDKWQDAEIEFFNDESVEFRGEIGAIRCRRPLDRPHPDEPRSLQQAISEERPLDDELPASFG